MACQIDHYHQWWNTLSTTTYVHIHFSVKIQQVLPIKNVIESAFIDAVFVTE